MWMRAGQYGIISVFNYFMEYESDVIRLQGLIEDGKRIIF
jgi:hypothetical protein